MSSSNVLHVLNVFPRDFFDYCHLMIRLLSHWGFPGGSDSKEPACNAGELGSIPGLGHCPLPFGASQVVLVVKNLPANAGDARDLGSLPGSGRSPGKEMATLSSILAWKIPWTEELGGLQSMGSQRVGQDLVTEQQKQLYKLCKYLSPHLHVCVLSCSVMSNSL